MLDVEEEGLDERSIIFLDAATRITKNGTSCFSSSDGKERCYVHALPGECDFVNSFGTDGRRRLEMKNGWGYGGYASMAPVKLLLNSYGSF